MYLCLNRGTCGGDLSPEEFTKLSADAGFDGADVDLGAAVARGKTWLSDLFSSNNQKFGGWGLGDWRNNESKHYESVEALKKQAAIARELQINSCCTWIMPSGDLSLSDNWRFHVARLQPCAEILTDNGLKLGLEFVAPYHLRRTHRHEFIFTPGQMLELASDIGGNVGLLVDCFHLHASGEGMNAISHIPDDKIVHVHLNDCVERDMTKVQDFERVLPGEGVIDTRTFIARIREKGYQGPVSLEVFNADMKKVDALPAAKRARTATHAASGL